jgi:hypothetical protein
LRTACSSFQSRALVAACAFAFVVTSCASGDDDDAVDRFAQADRNTFKAACECIGQRSNCAVETTDACEREVLRRQLDKTAPWFECAASSLEEQADCLHEARCEEGLRVCSPPVFMPMDCSEHRTNELEAAFEQASRECPKNIRCDDRTTVRGLYCNETPECEDGSDETACGAPLLFPCSDGTWLAERFVCDGVRDCEDGEDESCGRPMR